MSEHLLYNNFNLDYEPFPIGVFQPAISAGTYKEICDQFPPIELFEYKAHLGHKYSLSEVNNPKQYKQFIENNPLWRELHAYFKTQDFIVEVVRFLEKHHIRMDLVPSSNVEMWKKRQKISEFFKSISKNKIQLAQHNLKSRFEFSALPADKGNIKPHTDSPSKIITLVLTVVQPGEWNSSWGGGTDMLKPKDPKKYFNQLNDQLNFEDVSILKTYAFNPNQCLIFVKTFNSWHSVQPMTGPENVLRKTLTINIEAF